MKKRGQATLELFARYAWVLLGVLIMIGALSYFGILSPKKLLGDKCSFGSEIGCTEYVIGSNGVQLRLRNNAGTTIIVDDISASTKKTQLSCSSSVVGVVWEAGTVKDIPVVCGFADAGLAEGEKEKLDLEITYHAASASSAYSKIVQGEVFAVIGSEAISGGESVLLGTSCKDILDNGFSIGDGVYTIDPDDEGPINQFQVYCDMTNDDGGWTLVTTDLVDSTVQQYDSSLTMEVGANGGVRYLHISTASGCGPNPESGATIKIKDIIQWDQVRSNHAIWGFASCWGFNGDNSRANQGSQHNLQPFDSNFDTLQNCVNTCEQPQFIMPPMSRCDSDPGNAFHQSFTVCYNCWKSFELISRRVDNNPSGPSYGVSCNSQDNPKWKIEEIYIR